jgi:mono/diheme cytochrome c family protein
VYGLSYRWDSSGTNATLVPPDGQEEVFPVMDQGMLRTQRWRFPGRQECLACHHAAGGYALGFRTSHLNREYTFPGGTANQIHALSDAGYFTRPPEPRFALRSLPQGGDTRWSREARVRAYLAANCAHCHQPGGGGYGHFDVRVETPLSKAGLVRGLLANDGGNAQNRVIAPGSLERSMLYQRITSTGPDRMPPRGTTRVDAEAAALIEAWILQDLPQHLAYQEWRLQQFGETEQPRSAESGDADGDQASNWHEYLTGTDPQDPASHWRFSVTPEGGAWRIRYDRVARRTFEVQFSTNLIDWRIVDHLDNGPFSSSGPETVEWVDFPGAQEMGFYRVRVREP